MLRTVSLVLKKSPKVKYQVCKMFDSSHKGIEKECPKLKYQVCHFSSKRVVRRARDPLDLSFNDYQTAFKSKTTWEVFRALLVYTLCSSKTLVDNNAKIMKTTRRIFGSTLFSWVMKMSFYGHFVAGENEAKIQPTLNRLSSFGVHSILDYSVEEDISQEEAENREMSGIVPESGEKEVVLSKYQISKKFADRRYKVNSARTYFYMNEATCEKNMETFIRCLEAVPRDSAGFAAIKLTALGRPQLLLQISEVILRARQYMEELMGGSGSVLNRHVTKQDILTRLMERGVPSDAAISFCSHVTEDNTGVIHVFPWSGIIDSNLELSSTFLVPDWNTGKLVRLISQLSPNEEEIFRNMVRRVSTVIQAAVDLNVSVMVDAEQTYFQPAIARMAMELMRKFNTQRPVVYNTYQCYLKDTLDELYTDLEQAERQNFYFGAKLVRGAYLEQERARAEDLGYPDPTNPTYEATSDMYHSSLLECLRRVEILKEKRKDQRRVSVLVASHNEDTVRFTIEQMLQAGIDPEAGVVSFGQLFGMCDYITFPLGQSGFSVYKYIPYGPVNEVLPYLSRRAQENKGMLKKVKKEKALLRKELLRRIVTLRIFRKPVGYYAPA